MKKDTEKFLDFIDKELNLKKLTKNNWHIYLKHLPSFYNNDITFRLLFDWHWQLDNQLGRACIKSANIDYEEIMFKKQIDLIKTFWDIPIID